MTCEDAIADVATCPFCGQKPDVGPWTHGFMIACIGDVDDSCKIAPQIYGHELSAVVADWGRRA